LEGVPRARGPVASRNFCAAGNMSLPRARFLQLGGFDPSLSSGEDQDLALRHTERGGLLVFLPEAAVVHRDRALTLRSYCKRHETGSERIAAFVRKHPDLPDNV